MDDKLCCFCGVLSQYGHADWCKISRAPTANEVVEAVVSENERSVYEGPSEALTNMARAYLRRLLVDSASERSKT